MKVSSELNRCSSREHHAGQGAAEVAAPSNYRMNPTVGPVTGLANNARPAPAPPAGYAGR